MTDHPGWNPPVLRTYRDGVGLSRDKLAEVMRNLDPGRLGCLPPLASAEMIRRHERGSAYPGPDYQAAYGYVFGVTPVELGFRSELPFDRRRNADAGSAGGAPVSVLPAPGAGVAWEQQSTGGAPSGHGEAATNRRDVLELLAATVGVTLAGLPVLSPAQRLLALESTASGDTAISLGEAQLSDIVARYPTTSPQELLANVVALQRFTDGVGQLSLRPAESARLWRLATLCAGLRGWLHNNAGETYAARVSLSESYRRGELLEDDQLIAWTRYMQSVVEDYAGNTNAAEKYALDGLRHAPSGPQRALILVEQIAAVHATRGDLSGVDRATNEAMEIASALPADQQKPLGNTTIMDDLRSYSAVHCATYSGTAYSRLGRPDRFSRITADAQEAAERKASHTRSYLRLDEALAIARSKDSDPEQVASLATQGVNLASDFQSAHVGTRLDSIVQATAPSGRHPAIRDLNERARTWMSERLPRTVV